MGIPLTEAFIFNELQTIDRSWKRSYARAGLLCKEVHDRLLWRERCHSFSEWMKMAAPYGYAQAWAALRDVEALADIPAEDLAEIPQANFPTMKQLSSAVRTQPAVLQMAKTAKTEDFVAHIEREHPAQHVEHRVTMKFKPEAGAVVKIEEALRMAMGRGARTRDEALEMMAAEALMQWTLEAEVEGIVLEDMP